MRSGFSGKLRKISEAAKNQKVPRKSVRSLVKFREVCANKNTKCAELAQTTRAGVPRRNRDLRTRNEATGRGEYQSPVPSAKWDNQAMPPSEELIGTVLELLPTHPSLEALEKALPGVYVSTIREVLGILQQRGQVRAGELFGRD